MSEFNTYEDFLNSLGIKESSDNYSATNSLGYMGRYQMGHLALKDAGYIDLQTGEYTGFNGIYSDSDFLNSPIAQEHAIRAYHNKVATYISAANLNQYIGSEINGITVTATGILAAAHLKGIGKAGAIGNQDQGVRNYLESGGTIDPTDDNNTPVSEYMNLFQGNVTEAGSIPIPVRKPNLFGNGYIYEDKNGDIYREYKEDIRGADEIFGGEGDEVGGGSGNDLLEDGVITIENDDGTTTTYVNKRTVVEREVTNPFTQEQETQEHLLTDIIDSTLEAAQALTDFVTDQVDAAVEWFSLNFQNKNNPIVGVRS